MWYSTKTNSDMWYSTPINSDMKLETTFDTDSNTISIPQIGYGTFTDGTTSNTISIQQNYNKTLMDYTSIQYAINNLTIECINTPDFNILI